MEDNRQEFNEQKDNNKLKDLANDVKRNAVKLAASKIKSVVLSILSSILPLLLKVGIIALVGAVFISAVTYVVELLTASETPKNLYKTLNVENLNELVEIKPDSDRQGYHLEFVQDIDERIEKSIKQFNETIGNRINIEDKDTLKKFIQAEISTQFPDLVGESDGINKFQGAVKIKRLSPAKNIGEHKEVSEIKETILQYVDKETFDGYVVANSEQALKVFTLSEDKQQIVVATWSYVDGALSISGESNTMDYRSVVSQYTMPFEYPLFFLINGKNEDFANGLADLAINSKIDIAVIDNIVTTQIQTNVEVRKDSSNDHKVIENRSSTSFSEDMSSSIKVTNVESWWVKLKNSLTLNSSTSSYTMPAESVEKDLQDGYVQTTITYQYIDSITNQIQIGETTKESNEEGFVNLYNKHKEILKVLQPKWLFTMMDNNDKTKNMVELTKYLLYNATGNDYGVTEFNFDEYISGDFSEVSNLIGGSIEEKIWFALKDLGYSEYAVAGVLGNISAESGFNLGSIEDGSGIGAGLCQWSYGRRDSLENYAKSKGKEWTDENIQIEFLIGELTPGGGADGFATYNLTSYKGYSPSDWENANSAEEAAVAFCWTFERPGIPRLEERRAAARKYYDKYKGKEKPESKIVLVNNGDGYTQIYNSRNARQYKEYKQFQGSYKGLMYYTYGSISHTGCSITSIALVLTGYGIDVNPGDLRNSNNLAGHFISRGVSCVNAAPDSNRIVNNLKSGRAMVASISGDLKVNGSSKYYPEHYIALLDINDKGDQVYVSDPGSILTNGWASLKDIINIIDYGGILYTGE